MPPLVSLTEHRSRTNWCKILCTIIDIFLLNIGNDNIEDLKDFISSVTNLEHTKCSWTGHDLENESVSLVGSMLGLTLWISLPILYCPECYLSEVIIEGKGLETPLWLHQEKM